MPTYLRSWMATAVLVALFGAGCGDAPTPAPSAPSSVQDVSKTSCNDIPAARQRVLQAYRDAVEDAADTLQKARDAFEADLNQCLADVWKGGPCDKEWKASQEAAQRAEANIANDDAYYGWKKAKANWDTCYQNWDQKYKDWADKGKVREELCRDEFNAKRNAAIKAHEDAVNAAKVKRDADLATLDALEKACQEKAKTQTGGGVSVGGGVTTGGGVTGGSTTPKPPAGGQPGGAVTPPTVPGSACAPAGIPGSNSAPRTGKASDFGSKDIVIGLITQVAEDVTGSPIPTGVLDNQIFAGMVCVKIRSRIAEMTIEESDAQLSNDRPTEIRLRKKLAQYRQALNVWGKIAEGRPALPEIKKDVAALNAMPSGFCKTDADCASPLCCSANTIARSHCNAAGACVSQVENCPTRDVCMGPDNAQPLFDHCGPQHEGNWTFGQPKPGASWAHPQPGIPRTEILPPVSSLEINTSAKLEIHIGR